MKTYWLMYKDKNIDSQFSIDAMLEKEKDHSMHSSTFISPLDSTLYKPVTFEEIAKSSSSLPESARSLSSVHINHRSNRPMIASKASSRDFNGSVHNSIYDKNHSLISTSPMANNVDVQRKDLHIGYQNNLSQSVPPPIKHNDKNLENTEILSEKKIPNEQPNNVGDTKTDSTKKESEKSDDLKKNANSKTCALF